MPPAAYGCAMLAVDLARRKSSSRASTKTQLRPTLQDGTKPARASLCSVLGWTCSSAAAPFRSKVLMVHAAPGRHEKGPATPLRASM